MRHHDAAATVYTMYSWPLYTRVTDHSEEHAHVRKCGRSIWVFDLTTQVYNTQARWESASKSQDSDILP